MTEEEKYARFWAVLGEKAREVLAEYRGLSEQSRKCAKRAAMNAFARRGVEGVLELLRHPPKLK